MIEWSKFRPCPFHSDREWSHCGKLDALVFRHELGAWFVLRDRDPRRRFQSGWYQNTEAARNACERMIAERF